MKKLLLVIAASMLTAACGKLGVNGTIDQFVGNWAEVRLPAGCKPKQVAGESGNGVIVLCEDGRIFH